MVKTYEPPSTEPTVKTQVEGLIEAEVVIDQTAIAQRNHAGHEASGIRSGAFQEVLSLIDSGLPVPCEHEWIMHLTEMPHGMEKPGHTSCRKCGVSGADTIASGTTAIEPAAPVASEQDLFRLTQGSSGPDKK